MINQGRPKGAQFYVEGLYYKVGTHSFIYVWLGTQWLKSSKTLYDLEMIEFREEREFYNAKEKSIRAYARKARG